MKDESRNRTQACHSRGGRLHHQANEAVQLPHTDKEPAGPSTDPTIPDVRQLWLVACLTSQQQASVSQGRICSDKFTCCHNEVEAAD